MKRSLFAIVIAAISIVAMNQTPIFAQQTSTDATALANAKELMNAVGSDKQFDAFFPLIVKSVRTLAVKGNPSQSRAIDETLEAFSQKAIERRSELTELVAELYAERLSASDLKAVTEFFQSDVGKRYITILPSIIKDSSAIGESWGRKMGQEVYDELRTELKKRKITL